MPESDYITFRDSLIVALADEQEPPGLASVELKGLCRRRGIQYVDTWIQTVGADMAKLGWGRDSSTLKGHSFLINGSGLARAAEVRTARQPISLRNRIAAISRSDWIAFFAMVVSVIALFKGD